jgi:hypothetical protein
MLGRNSKVKKKLASFGLFGTTQLLWMCGMLKLTVGWTLIAMVCWGWGMGESISQRFWGSRFAQRAWESLATWCMELTPSGRSFLWIGNIAFLLLENQGGSRRLLAFFCHYSMGSLSRLSGLRGIIMLCSTASSGISKRSRIWFGTAC